MTKLDFTIIFNSSIQCIMHDSMVRSKQLYPTHNTVAKLPVSPEFVVGDYEVILESDGQK